MAQAADFDGHGLTQLQDPRYRAEAERVVALYRPLVEPLALAFGPNSEVVLHDFSRLPNSIVAISGSLSGRQVGGPATDLAVGNLMREDLPRYLIGYESQLPNGQQCRSSTIHLYGELPEPVGSLCVNTDVAVLAAARDVLAGLVAMGAGQSAAPSAIETFPQNVGQLSDGLIKNAIASVGVPVDMMSKRHKMEVVRHLKDCGFFLLRDAADLAGNAIGVSRFTVYKYLNDIEHADTK